MGVSIEKTAEKLQRLLQMGDAEALKEYLSQLQPADIAEIVDLLSETRRRQVFESLDIEMATRTFESMGSKTQNEVITSLPTPLAVSILGKMSSDDLADLLGDIEKKDAEKILSLIPEEAESLRELMQHPENTAGGLMTLDVISIKDNATVEQAFYYLRTTKPDSDIVYYVYVVNNRNQLVGVVSLRQLITASPGTKVGDIASTNVISVPADMDQEEVARIFEKYDLLALPVVDSNMHLLGVVTVDDVIDVIREETTEDISRMGGQEPLDEPYLSARVFSMVRKRIGWLLILFAAQSVTGNILAFFEESLETVIALAFFIPLLIDTAGNAGAQASTLVVRAMAMGEVTFKNFMKVVSRESLVGLSLGVIMAVVAFFWSRFIITGANPGIGYTVSLTIFAIIALASTLGAALPIVAKSLRFDPAVASAPLITTIADATGLIIYFTIARAVLNL